MERDYFLDAEQALEMGLVDKVLTSQDQEKTMAHLKGDKSRDDDRKEGNEEGGDGQVPSPPANPHS